ncbi:MAG: DUF4368 domain-containing protein, partial [Eubacteriales bacterium]|nr:DUF4368 domain-containing protein [Eubacteriales bacterium]
ENRLLEVIQDDIRKYAEMITVDEESLVNQIISQKDKDCHLQISNDTSLLKSTSQRLAELDKLIQSLYEDKVMGKISDSVFASLCPKYEFELIEKQELKSKLKQKLEANKQDKRNISRWIDLIKKCVTIELLDREMLLELIDYIEIGERQIIGNQKYRDITIHYKFVGNLC